MAKKKIGSISLVAMSETTAQYFGANNGTVINDKSYGLGSDSYLQAQGSANYQARRPDTEGNVPLLQTAFGPTDPFTIQKSGEQPVLSSAELVMSVWQVEPGAEILPGVATGWYSAPAGSKQRQAFMPIGGYSTQYPAQEAGRNLAKERFGAIAAVYASGTTGFTPTRHTKFEPTAPVSISIANAKGFDAEKMPETLTLSVETQSVLMAQLFARHAQLHSEQIKVSSASVEPEFHLVSGTVYAYGPSPVQISYPTTIAESFEIEFFGDPETGAVTAALAGSGAPIPLDGASDAWDNFLTDKAEYEAALAEVTMLAAIGNYVPVPVEYLLKPSSIDQLTFGDQKMIAEKWWEDYSAAVADHKPVRTKEEAYEASGSELPIDDWYAAELAKIADIKASTSSTSLWTATKDFIASAGGALAKGVGDYVSKYSPTEWVTAATGLWGASKVAKALDGVPSWVVIAAALGVVFLILK